MRKLMLVTTVPVTFNAILRGQPQFLSGRYNVTVVTSPESGWQEISSREGVAVRLVDMSRGIDPIRDLIAIIKMAKVIFGVRPDIIHSYTPKAGLVAMMAAAIARVPVRIHTFTGLIYPSRRGFTRFVLSCVDRLVCLCATEVIPESKGVLRQLVDDGITRKQLQLIRHGNIAGVDTTHFSRTACQISSLPADCSAGLVGGQLFTFVYIGRMHPEKGLQELVAAFGALSDARLILVGPDEKVAALPLRVRKEIERNDRIVRVGFVEDVRPILATADVLVLPSYREGFPNVVLQAGAMELPAIVTDVPGSNEFVQDGVNGWVVPVRDVQALTAAMQCAQNAGPSRLKEMGAISRDRVVRRFERKDVLADLSALYERLSCEAGI